MSRTTAVLVVVACLVLQAAESKEELNLTSKFSKPVERALRSIQPTIQQSSAFGSCTQQQVINISSILIIHRTVLMLFSLLLLPP